MSLIYNLMKTISLLKVIRSNRMEEQLRQNWNIFDRLKIYRLNMRLQIQF